MVNTAIRCNGTDARMRTTPRSSKMETVSSSSIAIIITIITTYRIEIVYETNT